MNEERPTLDPERVDLDMLAPLMDASDYGAGHFDPATGQVIPSFEGEALDADGEPADAGEQDWVPVEPVGSRTGYGDMEVFTAAVADPAVRRRLELALEGHGPFRRFRDALHEAPEPLRAAWFRFRDARAESRAIEWLVRLDLVEAEPAAAIVRDRAETADRALTEVAKRDGLQVEERDAPRRWPEILRALGDGRPVRLTSGGEPWAVIEPLNRPGTR
ncbi:hypothetical protein EXU48_08330 [Occultella glacieicola]|uniref:Uncharacterized protein n=1 Tax=Occultella glacieicola TaxID=2518684 RepID=A0ABY2E5L2_9MICO|nr:UPF0158 family protein [Occultella glacieicola]TDE94795.1 hypothetical protein EXU48_08330 [Occultella glacieicola]